MATLTRKNMIRKATPIEYALAQQSLGDNFLGLRIMVLLADDGTEQSEMLGSLAYLISLGAMVAYRTPTERPENRAGLAACLEAMHQMSLKQNVWDASWAYTMSVAIEVAMEHYCEYRVLATALEPSCRDFSVAIRNKEMGKLKDSLNEARKALGLSK